MDTNRAGTSVSPRVDVQCILGPVLNHVALGEVHPHVGIVRFPVCSRSTEKQWQEQRLHETSNLLVVQEGNEDCLLRVEFVRWTGRGYGVCSTNQTPPNCCLCRSPCSRSVKSIPSVPPRKTTSVETCVSLNVWKRE